MGQLWWLTSHHPYERIGWECSPLLQVLVHYVTSFSPVFHCHTELTSWCTLAAPLLPAHRWCNQLSYISLPSEGGQGEVPSTPLLQLHAKPLHMFSINTIFPTVISSTNRTNWGLKYYFGTKFQECYYTNPKKIL